MDWFRYAVVAFGIIFNVINVAILLKPGMRSTATGLLVFLATFDIFYLFFSEIGEDLRESNTGWSVFWGGIVGTFFQTGTWFLMVGIAVERFLDVCSTPSRPFRPIQNAWLLGTLLTMMALIVSLPEYLEYKLVREKMENFYEKYKFWGRGVLQFLIPLLTVAMLNGCMYVQIFRVWCRKVEQEASDQPQEEQEAPEIRYSSDGTLTKMVIAAIFLFEVCCLPKLIKTILEMKLIFAGLPPADYHMVEDAIKYIVPVDFLFLRFKSAMAFPTYFIAGKRFRKTFWNMCLYFTHRTRNTAENSIRRMSQFHIDRDDM